MAILTAEHLFTQAEKLLSLYPRRRPRQTELRRAISVCYYGVFHHILTNAADTYVGAKYRADPRYALAYRSVSHSWLRSLCIDISKPTVPGAFRPFLPAGRIGAGIRKFALEVINLQDKRHSADYDPSASFVRKDAVLVINASRAAVLQFQSVAGSDRQLFLAFLLFPPRGKA